MCKKRKSSLSMVWHDLREIEIGPCMRRQIARGTTGLSLAMALVDFEGDGMGASSARFVYSRPDNSISIFKTHISFIIFKFTPL